MVTVPATSADAAYESDAFFPGTIWSVQPAHPVYGFSGVPTNGMTVKNAAWRNLCRLTGRDETDQAECDGTFVINGGGGSKMSITRSDNGGVEILPSQTSADANTGGFFYAPDSVKQYVLDNSSQGNVSTDHDFAMVMWFVGVRGAKSGAQQDNIQIGGVLHNSSNPLLVVIATGFEGTPYSNLLDKGRVVRPSAFPLDTPTLRMHAGRSFVTKPLIANLTICAGFGATPPRTNAVYQNYNAGGVFYRADLIDLTVSGLSLDDTGLLQTVQTSIDYERVRMAHRRAIDFAFGVNGPFYGDNIPVTAASFA